MQKDELLKLAERVEALSGPDREVDGLIAIYIAPNTPYIVGDKPGPFPREPIHGTFLDCLVIENGKDRANYICAPVYTASLDAAMTLVPEGCGWLAGWGQTRPNEPMGGARITRNARFVGYGENYDEIAIGEAATPALALCAAALRALAKQ